MIYSGKRAKTGVVGIILAALLAVQAFPGSTADAAPASARTAPTKGLKGGALATFDVQGERFRVWVTNPRTIQQLQELLAGRSEAHIPNGRILPGPGKAAHNKPWRWHLDPQDISMAEITTEVCDARPSYVNQHVREFVHTVKRYCPWSAQLVALRVIPPIAAVPPATVSQ